MIVSSYQAVCCVLPSNESKNARAPQLKRSQALQAFEYGMPVDENLSQYDCFQIVKEREDKFLKIETNIAA